MEYIIRPACARDAAGIHLLRRMPGVFEHVLCIPSETFKCCEEQLQRMDSNFHHFVALGKSDDGGELVIGSATMVVRCGPRQRHIGDVTVMVHREYQCQGVGSALLNAILDLADNWLMLVRLEIVVFVGDERAIALCRKMGFAIEGRMHMAGVRCGRYSDMFLMGRIRCEQR